MMRNRSLFPRLLGLMCLALCSIFLTACHSQSPTRMDTAASYDSDTDRSQARLVIGNTGSNNVVAYELATGTFVGELISAGHQGLQNPDDFLLRDDGWLYVTSGANQQQNGQGVMRFRTEDFDRGELFTSGVDMLRPYGSVWADGSLFVAEFRSDRILEFNGKTGAFIDVVYRGQGLAGGINGPNDLIQGPHGKLWLTTQGTVAARDGTGTIEYLFPSQLLELDLSSNSMRVLYTSRGDAVTESGFSSLLGLLYLPKRKLIFATDFAGALLQFSDAGELIHRYPMRLGPTTRLGNLAHYGDFLYIPAFDDKTEDGVIYRINLNELNSQKSLSFKPWIVDPINLRRPIGITVLPN
ncbi:MAG: hypothetical protein ACI8Z1_003084 [Candidatus Azotimanducaceae bacterium]|jgi:hypothetical protein